MTIEAALFSRLTGFAGLAALVAARVYPQRLPQDAAYPAVSYQRVSEQRASTMGVDSALVAARFQFTAWADAAAVAGSAVGYDAAVAVRTQVRLALQRWSQVGPPVVQTVFIVNALDLQEEGDDGKVYDQLVLDTEIWFEE